MSNNPHGPVYYSSQNANGLTGEVQLIAGNNLSIVEGNNTITINATASGSSGVTSLNSETGAVNLVAGSNITITPSGQNITISASDTDSGVTSVATSSPITGGTITTTGTIGHATSGATAGSYTNASLTIDSFGHVTSASNGSIAPQPGYILAFAVVATDESTTSTTYVDLTTADSVSFILSSSHDILVEYFAFAYNNTNGGDNASEIYLDGTGQSATQFQQTMQTAGIGQEHVIIAKLSAVASGSHTIAVKHHTDTGHTAHWLNRSLKVSILA